MANVEDYEVLDWVGGGSFGSVSRVRRKHDDAVVCWKRVQYGGFSEAEKRAVVAEVNCLRELHSPFVVRFLDRVVDRKTTTIYIVMEYCEGGDLAHLLEGLRKRSTEGSPCFLEESKVTFFLLSCLRGSSRTPATTVAMAIGNRLKIFNASLCNISSTPHEVVAASSATAARATRVPLLRCASASRSCNWHRRRATGDFAVSVDRSMVAYNIHI